METGSKSISVLSGTVAQYVPEVLCLQVSI